MARFRAYRSSWLWIPAIVVSGIAQSAAVVAYTATRPTPRPFLTIHLDDAAASWDANVLVQDRGAGKTTLKVVSGEAAGFKITLGVAGGQYFGNVPQVFELPNLDTEVPVTISAPDGTTYQKRVSVVTGQETLVSVDYQPPRGQVLVTREGDPSPILRCSSPTCTIQVEPNTKLTMTAVLGTDSVFGGFKQYPIRTPEALKPWLGDPLEACLAGSAIDAAAAGHVYDCTFPIKADTDVTAEFAKRPNQVDVAFTDTQIDKLITPAPPKMKAPPPPIDAEKLDEKEVQVALAPPPKTPPPPVLPPPPPPPPDKKPPPPVQPPPNMTMVEVKDDKNVKDKAPDDAKMLSDKNRDVAEETRATKTNLDKESEGKAEASKESDDKTSAEIGGPDSKIRQLEETKATTDKHIRETDHSGDKQEAKGEIKGEGGDNGENGTGDNSPGVLSMRGIGGRGSVTDQSHDGKKLGRKGLPGVNTQMAFNDYERIVGKEKVDNEREVAARKMSAKKGRWERKLDAIKSSLENFVPDVRPGNQTALKTRAHPYALYIARMHRRIHELWGFGFLEDLDTKGADYPLNNPDLWVNLEISVNPDGTLHKVTIAKTSGKTEFDVAAVDTVISSGPFEATPEAIRSVDGRIYLRWGFYRNWRQCGTFNAEPYILTSVPDDNGVGVLDDGQMVANTAHVPGMKKKKLDPGAQPPVGNKTVTPDDGLAKQKVNPESSVSDKQALFSANQWISAFATAEVDKLVKLSTVPFYAGGKVAAETSGDLKDMYSGLVVESGPMKDWKLMTPAEYTQGGGGLPEGNLVLRVRTEKESFAIVLT
ncbi:MAG TPA: energy transducer TonB, partial [Kofleriaceae bacterium]